MSHGLRGASLARLAGACTHGSFTFYSEKPVVVNGTL